MRTHYLKKVNTTIILVIFIGILTLGTSCRDIVEKDLSKSTVTVNAPKDSLKTTLSTLMFWWEATDGADEYQIQIAKPSFTNIEAFITDTLVNGTKFFFSFTPGKYQWRIRAVNGSSNSPYQTYSITIDSTADISQQTISLLSPSENDTTNQTYFLFSWKTIYNANDYRFEIWSPDFNGNKILSINLEADTIHYTLPEGKYQWGIRGQNATTNTLFSKRSLFIDISAPNTPVLSNPTVKDSIVNFIWSRGLESGSEISDSLYVYSDTIYYNTITSIKTKLKTYSDTLLKGTYFWQVRSMDAAGNKSNYSSLKKLIIN